MRIFPLLAVSFILSGIAGATTVSLPPQKDNTLYEDGAGLLSNGMGAYLFAGKTVSNSLRRGLISFDLSSIPSNATIMTVSLSMYLSKTHGGSATITLQKASRAWGEGASDAGEPGGSGIQAEAGDATWFHTFYDTQFWTNHGGDFSATISATTNVSTVNTTYTWSGPGLVADVQTWIANPLINFGWLIHGTETTGKAQRFNSRENTINPPVLTVTYEAPTPTPSPTPTPVPTPSPGCGDTVMLVPSKDNTLYFSATGQLSNGQGIYFFDGKNGQGNVRRAIIAFDLSPIPASATITGATLSMFLSQANGGSQDVTISRVLQDWGEGDSNAGDPGGAGTQAAPGDATWLHTFYDNSFWTNPGGDFLGTVSAATTVEATDTTYLWSGSGLLGDVQTWVGNPATNFGWIIRGNEVTAGVTQRFNSGENPSNPPQLTVTFQLPVCTTPTPPPVNVSGVVRYCSNPSLNPVPNVTLTATGSAGGSTSTDGTGSYNLSLPSGGNYTVTPSKTALSPGSAGINTVDVVAIQRHFLILGTPLTGCRLQAADVNGIGGVNTVDVVAVQRFFLIMPTGIANVGKYQFNPVNRVYPNLVSPQPGQDYDTLVFGDVASAFVH